MDIILPNGKIVQWNNALYQYNKLRILTQTDYNNLNNSINNSLKLNIGSYVGDGQRTRTFNFNTPVDLLIVNGWFRFYIIVKSSDSTTSLTGNSDGEIKVEYNENSITVRVASSGDSADILNMTDTTYWYCYFT